MTVLVDDSISYNILGSKVSFFIEDTAYGNNVVAEYNDQYYYWGDEIANIELAIIFWQEQNNRMLSQAELQQIMKDNERESDNGSQEESEEESNEEADKKDFS